MRICTLLYLVFEINITLSFAGTYVPMGFFNTLEAINEGSLREKPRGTSFM
jgi:hypothetical protein